VNKADRIYRELKNRPVHLIEPSGRPHSAVAIILTETANGPAVLLMERATNEHDLWSGQIGFPGGRMEKRDSGPRQTAERETREELGVDLSAAGYLGRLSDLVPGGLSMVVSCFVYRVEQPPALYLDHDEVARAFWFPLREMENPARRTHVDLHFRGRSRRFPAVGLGGETVQPLWGISYRLLRNLCKVMPDTGNPHRARSHGAHTESS